MEFDYGKILPNLLTPDIMRAVSGVHEYRGKQKLYEATKPDALEKLSEVAKIQSTGASNRIENIKTSNARLRALMRQDARPRNRDEREIVGYRAVLNLIHSSYADIPVTPNVILQLHRDLYRGVDVAFAGHWKDNDNVIAQRTAAGNMAIRFQPPSAVETPSSIESLCEQCRAQIKESRYDGLLVSFMFVFDFVSIHPFNDGNGRMSRLLTLLLLYRLGYTVGRYISLEKEIEATKESYYDALEASSRGWSTGTNDYAPFVEYMLGVTLACYQELDRRLSLVEGGSSYEQSVRRLFEGHLGSLSKQDVIDGAGGMSKATADRLLQKLQREGFIEKVGAARATRYRKKEDDD